MYYYTDVEELEALRNENQELKSKLEELDALRVENAKLRANITKLVTKIANLEVKYKKGGKTNGNQEN